MLLLLYPQLFSRKGAEGWLVMETSYTLTLAQEGYSLWACTHVHKHKHMHTLFTPVLSRALIHKKTSLIPLFALCHYMYLVLKGSSNSLSRFVVLHVSLCVVAISRFRLNFILFKDQSIQGMQSNGKMLAMYMSIVHCNGLILVLSLLFSSLPCSFLQHFSPMKAWTRLKLCEKKRKKRVEKT